MEGVVTGFIGRGKGCGVCDWQPGLIGTLGTLDKKLTICNKATWCGVWLSHMAWSWHGVESGLATQCRVGLDHTSLAWPHVVEPAMELQTQNVDFSVINAWGGLGLLHLCRVGHII